METTIQVQGMQIPVEVGNYKVTMTYDQSEIITYDQFKSLAQAIFSNDIDFLVINGTIVQKRDVRMIAPTKELTSAHKAQVEQTAKKEHDDTIEKQREVDKYAKFRADYLNKKFGKDKWTLLEVLSKPTLLEEIRKAYEST